jgi:hypothetical protein
MAAQFLLGSLLSFLSIVSLFYLDDFFIHFRSQGWDSGFSVFSPLSLFLSTYNPLILILFLNLILKSIFAEVPLIDSIQILYAATDRLKAEHLDY